MEGLDLLQDLAMVMLVAGLAGWICQRIGLSSVVGFLVAGIIMGPYTPPFALVSDLERVQTLSQLGLVFLMFFIGMGLSIRRLQRMGAPTLLATAIGALLVLAAGRWAAQLIGWTPVQSLFFAALLMTSSSAIISKVLHEIGATHEPASRRAMTITVQEDIVAVIMLTVLTSAAASGGTGDGPSVWQTLGLILLFVIVLVIAGLLLVPRLLSLLARTADVDLQTIIIAGVMLGCALIAVRAGYSLALGAFLLGAIVAGTPQKPQIERYLQGMRDIFSAVFFVSIGMLMDLSVVAKSWHLVLGFGIFTVVLRTFVCTAGLIVTGNPTKEAVRTGVMLTPIGEFAFIIAQLGVTTGGAPELIYPLAVGIALFTAFTAPFLIKHSSRISDGIERLEPRFFRDLVRLYHRALEKIQLRRQGNVVWRRAQRPLAQAAIWILFVSGMLAYARPISVALLDRFGGDMTFSAMGTFLFWTVLGLVALPPLVAIWRNLSTLVAIIAETVAPDGAAPLRNGIQTALQTVAGFTMAIWIWLFIPLERGAIWTAAAVIFLVGILLFLLKQRLTLLHTRVESELQQAIEHPEPSASGYRELMSSHRDWDIHVHEIVLPDQAVCAGKSLSELELRRQFGCSIAGIERHGYAIPNPPPDFVLYPGDKLLLLATPQQLEQARKFVAQTTKTDERSTLADDIEMEGIQVPEGSHAAGKLLVELDIPAATGVQIVGIERSGNRVLNPGPFQGIEQGDQLLAFGTHRQIREFERWLRSGPRQEGQPEEN